MNTDFVKYLELHKPTEEEKKVLRLSMHLDQLIDMGLLHRHTDTLRLAETIIERVG